MDPIGSQFEETSDISWHDVLESSLDWGGGDRRAARCLVDCVLTPPFLQLRPQVRLRNPGDWLTTSILLFEAVLTWCAGFRCQPCEPTVSGDSELHVSRLDEMSARVAPVYFGHVWQISAR